MDQEKELIYLEHVEDTIGQRIAQMEAHLDRSENDILDSKRELWQNLYELDPEEIIAETQVIENSVIQHEDKQKALHVLLRQKDTPYFGRIDFQEDGDTEVCYIGLSNLMDLDSPDILVFDWRAPISSMYYNYELGPASFQAPAGKIEGEITGKFQYKIKDGKLLFMFDSSVTVQDEILQMELGGNASDRMKNIIATIQKEQNQIVRAESRKTLIVQGAAGSGKTSIALHRVAFLLYQYRKSLRSSNILIISPSRIFSHYISGVLPELGEESIVEMSLADLAERELCPQFKLESRFQYIDRCLAYAEPETSKYIDDVQLKASAQLVTLMEEYIREREKEIYVPKDLLIGGVSIAQEEKLQFLYQKQYARSAPVERMRRIREYIGQQLRDYTGGKPTKQDVQAKIEEELNSWQNYGTLQEEYNLWIDFLIGRGLPAGNGITHKVPFQDVFPLLLFKFKFFGQPDYRFIKHLIVDEMQDYTAVQYEILNMLFPCPKTILGDIDQVIDPFTNIGTLDSLRDIYQDQGVSLELKTSYRSTFEISETAKCILGEDKFTAIARHGEKPRLMQCSDYNSQAQAVLQDITAFLSEGYTSITVLCKTAEEAKRLWQALEPHMDIRLMIDPDECYDQGAVITTCYIAKGLEFDCVLIPNCDNLNYCNPYGRKPLYVACTRALHQLRFFHCADTVADYLQCAVQSGLVETV